MLLLFWHTADAPAPAPTPTTGAGGGHHRRQHRRVFTYADGSEVEVTSDAHLERIIEGITKAKRPKKPGRKAKASKRVKPEPTPVPPIDPAIIARMLQAMSDLALTEQSILTALDIYARGMAQDDEDMMEILLYI